MASPSRVGAEGEWGQPNLWALGGLIVERGEKKKVQKKRKINERNEGVLDTPVASETPLQVANGHFFFFLFVLQREILRELALRSLVPPVVSGIHHLCRKSVICFLPSSVRPTLHF